MRNKELIGQNGKYVLIHDSHIHVEIASMFAIYSLTKQNNFGFTVHVLGKSAFFHKRTLTLFENFARLNCSCSSFFFEFLQGDELNHVTEL